MKILIALIALALPVAAQNYSAAGTPNRFYVADIPASDTVIVAGTVYLKSITFVNKSTTVDDVITVTDRGTNCSGACPFVFQMVIAPKTTYTVHFDESVAPNGIKWLSTGGTTTGRVRYVTALNQPR